MKKGLHEYRDATMVAVKNKRVMVKPVDENIIRLHFVRKLDEGENSKAVPCDSFIVRDRLRSTQLNISREAAEMLLEALFHELRRRR